MSAKKGLEASSVVVSGGPKKNRVGPRSRLTLLVVGGVILLIVIGAGVYFAFLRSGSKDATKDTTKSAPNFVSKNMADPTSSNYSADIAAADKAIQNASDNDAKATAYIQKADLVIINKGYNNDALEYAQKAEELSPTMKSAFELAVINEGLGKKQDAIKYYSLYLSRMTPEYRQANPGNYENYERVLQELQKS